jgi:mRNA interferase MazF
VAIQATGSRGDIYLVPLNQTRGSESRKARPWVIISPDDLNAQLCTFIMAPLASGEHSAPFRIRCGFARKEDLSWLIGWGPLIVNAW